MYQFSPLFTHIIYFKPNIAMGSYNLYTEIITCEIIQPSLFYKTLNKIILWTQNYEIHLQNNNPPS